MILAKKRNFGGGKFHFFARALVACMAYRAPCWVHGKPYTQLCARLVPHLSEANGAGLGHSGHRVFLRLVGRASLGIHRRAEGPLLPLTLTLSPFIWGEGIFKDVLEICSNFSGNAAPALI